MKKTAVACAMVLMLTTGAMAGDGKTAYVDTQAVFEKTSLGKKYQGIVREYYESRKKVLDTDAAEIQKLQEEYSKQKQAKLLNEKAQKSKEDVINRKINEFQKKRDEFGAEIGKKNEELSTEFSQKMQEIIKAVAKKEKVSLVLTKGINIMSKSEIPSVLYAEDELDLTEKIVAEMNKREPGK